MERQLPKCLTCITKTATMTKWENLFDDSIPKLEPTYGPRTHLLKGDMISSPCCTASYESSKGPELYTIVQEKEHYSIREGEIPLGMRQQIDFDLSPPHTLTTMALNTAEVYFHIFSWMNNCHGYENSNCQSFYCLTYRIMFYLVEGPNKTLEFGEHRFMLLSMIQAL